MAEILRRMVWFFIVACAISYAVFLILGSAIERHAADLSRIVIVRDVLGRGSHHLSGMVMVPSSCSELSVRTDQLSTTTYDLLFQTWKEPSVDCDSEDTPRAFHAVIFGPATGVDFVGSIDQSPLQLVVYPTKAD